MSIFTWIMICTTDPRLDPVLLCNDLRTDGQSSSGAIDHIRSSGRTSTSIKDAVRIARNNNFMGLLCSSDVLELAPALIESIKVAGLVLVSDVSSDGDQPRSNPSNNRVGTSAAAQFYGIPDGIDGILKGNGVLVFNDTIDM